MLTNTIYKPNNDIKEIGPVLAYQGYFLNHLVQLGLIENKKLNNKWILSDKGFEFLLWLKKNYLKEIIVALDASSSNFQNHIDLLIKEEDLPLVLSITRNPNKFLTGIASLKV